MKEMLYNRGKPARVTNPDGIGTAGPEAPAKATPGMGGAPE